MKILLLSGEARDSGCWVRVQYLGNALRKLGNEVHLLTPLKTMPARTDLIISIPLYLLKSSFTSCDLVMGFKPYPQVGVTLLWEKLKGAKVIIDIDDLDYGYRGGFLSSLLKLAQSPLPRRCDLVTYHNQNLFSHIIGELRVPPQKTFYLGQGVDLSLFNPKKVQEGKKEEIAKKHRLSGKKVVLYTAHLNIASDLEPILEAFSLLIKQDPQTLLLVAGGGPWQAYFERLAEEMGIAKDVIFTGYLPKEEIPSYISIAQVCLLYYKDCPANHYRSSMKLREYLAMGKKVVSNDVGELKSFSKYTFQSSSDLGEYASKILGVLKGEDDERNIEGQSYVRKNFSWERIARRFQKRLERLLYEDC
jgi:glycosyltransferase involved in cell wall biosynthesis